jgi:hypothetical protein
MTPAMSRRDSQMPHPRSGGISPLIGRNVCLVTAAAQRERNDPLAGTPSVMQRSQPQMVTLVNGSFRVDNPGIRVAGVASAADVPDVRGGATLLTGVVPPHS